MRSLDARLLPLLAEDDLHAEPDQVPRLLSEATLVRERLDEVAHGTRCPHGVEEHRDLIR